MTQSPVSSYNAQTGLQEYWDATSITLAQTCLRKYYYKNFRGLTPKNLSVHLWFGGHYATAHEHFYKHRAEGIDYEDALRMVVKEAIKNTWDKENGRPYEFKTKDGMPETAKTRFNLIRSIIWYLEEFGKDSQSMETYHFPDGTPAVELSFTLDIDDDLILCGHLDQVVKYGDDLYVMDQKTTGNAISQYFFNYFSPDNQMSLYTWAGQAILKTPVRGVIIDAAQIGVGFTRFGRGFTHRTPAQLEEWLAGARYTIDLARMATERNFYPMNLASCGNYGGCEYRGLCSRSPQVRENFIKGDFDEGNRWDPVVPRN